MSPPMLAGVASRSRVRLRFVFARASVDAEISPRRRDLAFDDFNEFFVALRGERDRLHTETPQRDLGASTEEVPDDQWAGRFGGTSDPHALYRNAIQRGDGTAPRLVADDALVAATQDRLGLELPVNLVAPWRERNGGRVAARFVRFTEGTAVRGVEVMRFPIPLESVVTLAVLSDSTTS